MTARGLHAAGGTAPGAWSPPRQPRGGSHIRESALQQTVLELCRWRGLLAYHTRDSRGSDPGFPDLVVTGSRGVLFRELKSDTGKLSKAQGVWRDGLVEAGADWGVWTPADWESGRIVTELRAIALTVRGGLAP